MMNTDRFFSHNMEHVRMYCTVERTGSLVKLLEILESWNVPRGISRRCPTAVQLHCAHAHCVSCLFSKHSGTMAFDMPPLVQVGSFVDGSHTKDLDIDAE